MASRLDELAEGFATLLVDSAKPEPLRVDLRNHSSGEVAFLVRAVADACERLGGKLALVRIGEAAGKRLLSAVDREPLSGGTRVLLAEELGTMIEFFRR